jgi:hypothetical protein
METSGRFQMTQLEQAQALNLLGRVYDRLYDVESEDNLPEMTAECNIARLINHIERADTNLDARTITLAELAGVLRNYEDLKVQGSVIGYVARYLSNYDVDETEFMLAGRYTLPAQLELLRACEHGTDNSEVCPDCLDKVL